MVENNVGKDLQWIRVNGAVCGFLIGLVLVGIKALFNSPPKKSAERWWLFSSINSYFVLLKSEFFFRKILHIYYSSHDFYGKKEAEKWQ